jgi:hypothetical protein
VELAVDLNSPGTYLHWYVFWISAANLAVIGSMLVIFFAALLLPFPAGRQEPPEAGDIEPRPPEGAPPVPSTSWTGRVRGMLLRWLPPQRLLPETQPSYVASWAYVFGVASLAALAMAVVSGFLIALGGVDWWHTNAAGHFFNSMHLWSVEMFMAFLVIHLWAKFFMAAWRGGRARTWLTGVLAFLVSIGEAFTGYLSQQNFDSQWISTNGKDAFNSAGLGGWFNLMDFGQMLLWHIVLVPLLLVAIVGLHVLFVRYRGVVHPFPARRGRDPLGRQTDRPQPLDRRTRKSMDRSAWQGPVRRYDLVREAVAATAIVAALTFALAGGFSSPDVPPITIQRWAKAAPADFVGTAASELAGTSETAAYGPPYNHRSGSVQEILGLSWQRISGVWTPINAARAFVVGPLTAAAGDDPGLHTALSTWNRAPAARQSAWAHAYLTASRKLRFDAAGAPVVPPGSYGPVPEMMKAEYRLARSGALDASLVAQHEFYGTDFTKPLLFLEDGGYFNGRASAQRLLGDQWGVMNETGSYPGQPWLWLYQLWYHVPGLSSAASVDLAAIYLTGAATLLLALIPFIPGLRDIPRLVPLYRVIWRRYYREAENPNGSSGT